MALKLSSRRVAGLVLKLNNAHILIPVSPFMHDSATHFATPAQASRLTVRRLKIDLGQGFERHWHGGDAFKSQYYNALSMSFPVGEQSFIDSVKDALKLLPETPENACLGDTAARFIGQEATHRHVHALYNAQLEKQGLVNRWQHWAARRIAFGQARGLRPLHWLAITAAYEHCTAVFADGTLRHDDWLAGADPRMQLLWRWHAAEEIEHRAVAFDLYTALGGSHGWRVRWYLYALMVFTLDAGRQTVLNLWRDGTLFKPGTWWSAAGFFLGRQGSLWRCAGPLLGYLRRDFHPDRETHTAPDAQGQALAARWLADNAGSWRAVR
ncbi:MAG: metal-dependent hydrolase [Polaromonas sp.]|nr:metal-dependent hydrolase [Polaromonas sp.]